MKTISDCIAVAIVAALAVLVCGLMLMLMVLPVLLAIMAAVTGNLGSAVVLMLIQISIWIAFE